MKTASKARFGVKALATVASGGYAAGRLVGTARAGARTARGSARAARATARRAATTPTLRRSPIAPIAAGAAAGAVGAYFLDPQQGKRRRHIARDKGLKYLRRGSREARRRADYTAGAAIGAARGATPSPRDPARDLNDPALARKVESEIFRDRDAPKGKVNVSVEDGVVYLRGEVDSPAEAGQLAEAARQVEGARDVESLLHVEGEPARSKDGAKQPSRS